MAKLEELNPDDLAIWDVSEIAEAARVDETTIRRWIAQAKETRDPFPGEWKAHGWVALRVLVEPWLQRRDEAQARAARRASRKREIQAEEARRLRDEEGLPMKVIRERLQIGMVTLYALLDEGKQAKEEKNPQRR